MSVPLVEVASEFLAKAFSTSELLTINLTNLLILIALKVPSVIESQAQSLAGFKQIFTIQNFYLETD